MTDARVRQICAVLPPEVADAVLALPPGRRETLEEVRLRRGCEITAVLAGREAPLSLERPLVCTGDTLEHLVNTACGYSAYAAADALRQGFLPLAGGHRLGLCGTAVLSEGRVTTLKEISSANLRVAGQRLGCAGAVADALGRRPENALILGPPGSGKTTLLRDLVRQLSDRLGQRVGLVDSRGELAACVDGQPQLAVGRRTDVVSLMPKAEAMELLIRSMSPRWIAVDEITAPADVEAMAGASYCGVGLLATAHGYGREDLARRPLYRRLAELGVFSLLVILDGQKQYRMERMD